MHFYDVVKNVISISKGSEEEVLNLKIIEIMGDKNDLL
ncbi:hypothetical protein M918_03985 [Clostridium sp. BL8]|nr:hypothetical protein M918_03985 [Clostridium sp. BL8]